MKNKLLIILIALFLTSSCAEFGKKRSEKSDEFLIEKKAPLVMPPDIDELPKPKEVLEEADSNENILKGALKSNDINSQNSQNETSSSLQESIIKKIEE